MNKSLLTTAALRRLRLLSLLLAGSLFFACSESEAGNPYLSDRWMIVETVMNMQTRDEAVIAPTFDDAETEGLDFVWTSTDPEIVRIVEDCGSSVRIEGMKAGKAFIKVECPGETKRLSATISVTVNQAPLRILAIGNSFSQDAVEQYLYELFQAAGIEAVVGNLYIGGCSLERHWTNAENNQAAYEYRKVVNGEKSTRKNISIFAALKDEKWDYVSLQQVSGLSGQYASYEPYLSNLLDYVAGNATNGYMVPMLHQTWAYAANSTHADFPKYDKSQMKMYEAIVDAVEQAAAAHEIDLVIPSGTAIQNARTSFLGDSFNRDGYHLETTYGRYTAACTWFERISGRSVVGNAYVPAGLGARYAAIAQHAAHLAVEAPRTVTVMTDFQKRVETDELSAPVYVDFGSSATAMPWNVFSSAATGAAPVYLSDAAGAETNVRVRVAADFSSVYAGAGGEDAQMAVTVGGVEYPVAVWKDGLVVSGAKGAGDVGPAVVELSGLSTAHSYDVSVLAKRWNGSRSARESQYVVRGRTVSAVGSIRPGIKTSEYPKFEEVPFEDFVVNFPSVEPAEDGTLRVEVRGIDTGAAAEGHINALVLTQAN